MRVPQELRGSLSREPLLCQNLEKALDKSPLNRSTKLSLKVSFSFIAFFNEQIRTLEEWPSVCLQLLFPRQHRWHGFERFEMDRHYGLNNISRSIKNWQNWSAFLTITNEKTATCPLANWSNLIRVVYMVYYLLTFFRTRRCGRLSSTFSRPALCTWNRLASSLEVDFRESSFQGAVIYSKLVGKISAACSYGKRRIFFGLTGGGRSLGKKS